MRPWIILAAVNGFVAVAAGAIGSHALRHKVGANIETFETAVRYHMWHALALLGVAWLASLDASRPVIAISGWGFMAGIVLFCGSLYIIGVTGVRTYAGAAPIGGISFLIGWAALGVAAWRLP